MKAMACSLVCEFHKLLSSSYLLAVLLFSNTKVLSLSTRFVTVEDNAKVVTGLVPYRVTEVQNPIQCHHFCHQTPDKCCYIQTESSQNGYLCSLYDFIGEINNYLTTSPTENGRISAVVNNQRECLDWFRMGYKTNGVFYINHQGNKKKVFCDMTTEGGGWTLFQRRFDGSVSFHPRTWEEYKKGFGDVYGEHWAGNEFLHQFTKERKEVEFAVHATRFNGETQMSKYTGFKIDDETTSYRLNLGTFSAGQYDEFNRLINGVKQNGQGFSTFDQDVDKSTSWNCAARFTGGFWHSNCFFINFNGHYDGVGDFVGIIWQSWTQKEKLMKSQMMFRRKDY